MTGHWPAASLTPEGAAYVDMGGTGPALLLIHGVGLDHTMWAGMLPCLAGDWRVILVDMPGHGASAVPPADAGLAFYAAQVVSVLDALGIARCAVAGFSMGALVARCLALRHPEKVSALVLMNGVFDRAPGVRANVVARVDEVVRGGPGANAEAALERWFTPEWHRDHPKAIEAVRRKLHANDPQGYLVTYRLFATEDNYGAGLLQTIAVPTLVLTGEHDVGSTPEMTRALAACIPGATAVVIPGARHMMPVEQPAATAAPIRAFLEPLLTTVHAGQDPVHAGEIES